MTEEWGTPCRGGNPKQAEAGERYVDGQGIALEVSRGEGKQRVYGALSARYWLGDPGVSELVAGTAYFWEPILEGDADLFLEELKLRVLGRLALGVSQKTGLELSWASRDLDRTEWLVEWHPGPDLVERTRAFEQGWSRMLPAGTRARDLTGPQLSQLARRTYRPRMQ
jgi:hypothetical protein